MSQTMHLFKIGQTKIMAKKVVAVFFIVIAVVAGIIARLAFPEMGVVDLILAGLLGAVVYYLGLFIHHLGHAFAAWRTGYPMSGILFVTTLATSLYPKDEPELPAATHIRRALGGPIASLIAGMVFNILMQSSESNGGLLYWLALWGFFINIFVFSLGALIPMRLQGGGITDGATIIKYMRQGNG